MSIGMSWSHEGQRFYSGDEAFTHDGPINIDPSHDCAHLLIAANGDMLWNPKKENEKRLIQIAEYNASILERFLYETFDCFVSQSPGQDLVPKVVKYAKWFVEEHFAPFPMSAREALESFCSKLNKESIIRLSPHFFRMKRSEVSNRREFRSGKIVLTFERDDCPSVDEEIGKIQSFLRDRINDFAGVN